MNSPSTNTVLRFAPIVRVSTEQQEKQGESLRTQKTQILSYVESLNGIIPESCWAYSGQEHATPDMERNRLDKLLADSGKGIFDAVICCDASRWSRDNRKSKDGLEILRKNGIRFFVGTMEYDLYNPSQNLFLGMATEINEYHAQHQSLKSIQNRIERAKRGIPTAGSLPFGRLFDKKTGLWSLDKEKQKLIQTAASRYIKGEGLRSIALSLGVNLRVLWRVLTLDSGPVIIQHFANKRLNVKEDVAIDVPPLLDFDTITAIHERVRANKTYHHGQVEGKPKSEYLLSRMIFCARCGCALTAHSNGKNARRYYRHTYYETVRCKLKHFIPAPLIENTVLIELVRSLGDPFRMREAVKLATPNESQRDSLQQEQHSMENELKSIVTERESIIDLAAKGLLMEDEIHQKMTKIRSRIAAIENRLSIIQNELSQMPDLERVKRLSGFAGKILLNVSKSGSLKWVIDKPFNWKRTLIENAFSGLDAKGQRMGVYIIETDDDKAPFKFEIRGVFEPALVSLPLPDDYLIDVFNLDQEFCDVDKELENIKNDVFSYKSYSRRIRRHRKNESA